MKPAKIFGFLTALEISVSALLVCGVPSYGQRLDVDTEQAKVGTFVTFDVPGADLGTFAVSINDRGVITGGYNQSPYYIPHGFVRSRDGTFVTFDPQNTIYGTFAAAINSEGEITGQYDDPITLNYHGFLRRADGSIVTFDPPGSINTTPTAINASGEIAGWYYDSNFYLGFLRFKDGSLTTFEAPGSGTGGFQGTFVASLNPAGTITGSSVDQCGVFHGFLRARDGAFTTFDPSGSTGTNPVAIGPDNTITGWYFAPSGILGFVRAPDGAITSFSAPVAGPPPGGPYTMPLGINAAGTVSGWYLDAHGAGHGFLRARDGTFTTFDTPGAGTASGQGTDPIGFAGELGFVAGTPINAGRAVTGYYVDSSGGTHGLLLSPAE
jgi:hypothetical protein